MPGSPTVSSPSLILPGSGGLNHGTATPSAGSTGTNPGASPGSGPLTGLSSSNNTSGLSIGLGSNNSALGSNGPLSSGPLSNGPGPGGPGGPLSGLSGTGGPGCCEGGRILGTNPHTGAPLCSCQAYSPSGLLSTYSRVAAGLSDSVYGPAAPYSAPGYVPFGTPDPSAFYPPLVSTFFFFQLQGNEACLDRQVIPEPF